MHTQPNSRPRGTAPFEQSPTGVAVAIDIATAGAHYIEHRRILGRKRSTLMDYESTLRIHLVPYLGGRSLEEIDVGIIESFIYAKHGEGKAPKSIANYLGLLSGIFSHGAKRGWCSHNPVTIVDKPRAVGEPDIRFLSLDELEAILEATPDDERGRTERILYLTAAMTGMRRGEIIALRWKDIDWHAQLIRVRRNFVRGEFGTPKSRRSSRTVPLAPRLATELAEHHERSRFCGELDLVFAHPATGTVLDPYKLRRRFRAAAGRAGVRPVRFHDLRHTFGTQMAASGAPLRAIQEWMGHSDYRTTSIYADYALDPNQGALYAERAFRVAGSSSQLMASS